MKGFRQLWFYILLSMVWGSASWGVEVLLAYENKMQFPYYLGNHDEVENPPGAAVEMLKELETVVPNLKVSFIRVPWKRCLSGVKSGIYDGTFNTSFKKYRMEMGVYPRVDGKLDGERRITTIAYHLYQLKDRPALWNGDVMAKFEGSIGAPLGFSIVHDLKTQGISVSEYPHSLPALKAVSFDRIPAAALQAINADYYLSQPDLKLSNIVKIYPPLKTKHYYLLLSHQFKSKYPELAEAIWDGIATLRNSRFETILHGYMQKDASAKAN